MSETNKRKREKKLAKKATKKKQSKITRHAISKGKGKGKVHSGTGHEGP